MGNQHKAESDCNCKKDFDARRAYQELARDFTRLVDAITPLLDAAAPPATRGAAPSRLIGSATRGVGEQGPDPLKTALRIVGGRPTNRFPSCCCVGGPNDWYCSGVLVAPDVILTAAHCGAEITRALVGGIDIENPGVGEILPVSRVFVHPGYDAAMNANDISLIVLASSSQIDPMPLATRQEVIDAGQCTLVGFGYNDGVRQTGFGTKRAVTETISAFPRTLAEDMARPEEAMLGYDARMEFVAGRKHLGRDTCNGDSGGPAYLDTPEGYKLGGLTSRATLDATRPCGDGGIYVMPDAHREWLNRTLASLGKPPLT